VSWERRVIAQFEAEVRRAEAKAGRLRSRQSTQETADEKDLRLAEQQRRLEEESSKLDKTAILKKASLQRQIKWYERQITAIKRQRKENRGLPTTLEY